MSRTPADPADVAALSAGALGAVIAGGMVGTLLRLALGEALPTADAVLVANLTGAFALGLLYARLRTHRVRRSAWWNACGPGLLGAFTTFSALQLEVIEQVRDGYPLHAFGYLAVTVGFGVPLAALGHRLGARP